MPSKLVDFKLDNGETIKVAEQVAEYLNRYLPCIRKIESIDTLILFGSALEERYTPGKSDIDLMYITEDKDRLVDEMVEEQYKDCYTFFDMGISTDELVFTAELNQISTELTYEIITKGKVIYRRDWNKR